MVQAQHNEEILMLSVGTGIREHSVSSDSTEMHQEHCWPTAQPAHAQGYMVSYFLQNSYNWVSNIPTAGDDGFNHTITHVKMLTTE